MGCGFESLNFLFGAIDYIFVIKILISPLVGDMQSAKQACQASCITAQISPICFCSALFFFLCLHITWFLLHPS
jgi:hypothetical protein